MHDALLAGAQITGPGFGALGVADDLILATPIHAQDGNHTVLFVSCKREPGTELRSDLRALCSQIAQTIELANPRDDLSGWPDTWAEMDERAAA